MADWGFNGAADLHPRKPGRRRRLELETCGFNGAADLHPRKPALGRPRAHRVGASMGPRIFIRGNLWPGHARGR